MTDPCPAGPTGVSRRRFLQAAGCAGAGLAAGPILLHATRKSGGGRPVAGTGEHTYEVYHDWGELPASIRYGNTHGVCQDAQGQIYVHHTGRTYEEVEKTLDRDHFMSAEEAKAWGIVDHVYDKREQADSDGVKTPGN